jgi:hypothetical protein
MDCGFVGRLLWFELCHQFSSSRRTASETGRVLPMIVCEAILTDISYLKGPHCLRAFLHTGLIKLTSCLHDFAGANSPVSRYMSDGCQRRVGGVPWAFGLAFDTYRAPLITEDRLSVNGRTRVATLNIGTNSLAAPLSPTTKVIPLHYSTYLSLSALLRSQQD